MTEITKNALQLWALTLIPSLFPSMIITTLFMKLSSKYLSFRFQPINDLIQRFFCLSPKGFTIFILGNLCGYPLGAKLTADAYKENSISLSEANYLLTICNQASPAFLEFYICSYALDNRFPARYLFILFYGTTILTSLISRKIYQPAFQQKSAMINPDNGITVFTALDQSIQESCFATLRIGGYIVIFAIINYFIDSLPFLPKQITMPISILLEITNGIFILKSQNDSSGNFLFFILLLCSFGGFCTMAQIKGMLVGTPLSIKPYIIGKIIFCILIAILTIGTLIILHHSSLPVLHLTH